MLPLLVWPSLSWFSSIKGSSGIIGMLGIKIFSIFMYIFYIHVSKEICTCIYGYMVEIFHLLFIILEPTLLLSFKISNFSVSYKFLSWWINLQNWLRIFFKLLNSEHSSQVRNSCLDLHPISNPNIKFKCKPPYHATASCNCLKDWHNTPQYFRIYNWIFCLLFNYVCVSLS